MRRNLVLILKKNGFGAMVLMQNTMKNIDSKDVSILIKRVKTSSFVPCSGSTITKARAFPQTYCVSIKYTPSIQSDTFEPSDRCVFRRKHPRDSVGQVSNTLCRKTMRRPRGPRTALFKCAAVFNPRRFHAFTVRNSFLP